MRPQQREGRRLLGLRRADCIRGLQKRSRLAFSSVFNFSKPALKLHPPPDTGLPSEGAGQGCSEEAPATGALPTARRAARETSGSPMGQRDTLLLQERGTTGSPDGGVWAGGSHPPSSQGNIRVCDQSCSKLDKCGHEAICRPSVTGARWSPKDLIEAPPTPTPRCGPGREGPVHVGAGPQLGAGPALRFAVPHDRTVCGTHHTRADRQPMGWGVPGGLTAPASHGAAWPWCPPAPRPGAACPHWRGCWWGWGWTRHSRT